MWNKSLSIISLVLKLVKQFYVYVKLTFRLSERNDICVSHQVAEDPGSVLACTLSSSECGSHDSIYRKYRYIVFDIDTSYRIVGKISNFSIYRDILRQKFLFLLLHYQNNVNKRRKRQTNQSKLTICLLYTSPSPRDRQKSRMPSSA